MQIAVKEERRDKVIEYLGSAHTLPLDLTPIPTVPRDLGSFSRPGQDRRGAGLQVLGSAVERLARALTPAAGLGEAVGGDRTLGCVVFLGLGSFSSCESIG